MYKIKVGDLVRLRVGKRECVVSCVEGEVITVLWCSLKGEVIERQYLAGSLVVVKAC